MTHRNRRLALALALGGCVSAGTETTREQATAAPAPAAPGSQVPSSPPPASTAPRRGWPMFRGGPGLQGRSQVATGPSPAVAWEVDLDRARGCLPVTSGDGRTYVTTEPGLVALDAQGHELWRFTPSAASAWSIGQAAVIDDDHIFYLDIVGNRASVLDREGNVLGSSAVSPDVGRAVHPTVHAGRVYLTAGAPGPLSLHVLDATATEVLSSSVGEGARPTEALVTPQGEVWFMAYDPSDAPDKPGAGTLLHLDSGGTLLDARPVPPRASGLVQAPDGSLFLVAEAPDAPSSAPRFGVYRVPAGGQLTLAADGLEGNPSLGLSTDGALLVSHAGGLRKLALDGGEVYRIDAVEPSAFRLSAWSVAAGDGTEIVADVLGRIYGVRQGAVAWQREVPAGQAGWGPNLALTSEGLLIACTWTDTVVAFR